MTSAPETVLPATLLTGFLGSGKTTLLNRLLAQPAMGDTAVIVNEFGEIGLDHLLLETAFEDAVLLRSGCICCTVRGDLVDTLLTLYARRRRGEIPPFARVAIETTGLADPAPILQSLMEEPSLVPLFRLDRVVATVDAVNALAQLDRHYEAAKQVALADRLVLTKTDLVAEPQAAKVRRRLSALNPGAPIIAAVQGRIDAAALFEAAPTPAEQFGRLAAAAALGPAHAHAASAGEDEAEHQASHHGIATVALVRSAPVEWPALRAWLLALAAFKGAELLRLKGLVNVEGYAGPVVLHGVQHLFHPPVELARWPDEDRRSRIICITRNIPAEALVKSFEASLAGGAAKIDASERRRGCP